MVNTTSYDIVDGNRFDNPTDDTTYVFTPSDTLKTFSLAGDADGDTVAISSLSSDFKVVFKKNEMTLIGLKNTPSAGVMVKVQFDNSGGVATNQIAFLDGTVDVTFTPATAGALKGAWTFGGENFGKKVNLSNENVQFAIDSSKTYTQAAFDANGVLNSESITLTTGTDNGAAFTGTSGNDTFEGTDTTLTIFDDLKGGEGTDSLTLTFAAAVNAVPAGVKVAAIENISIQAAGTVNVDISGWTGVEEVTILGAGADNDVTVVSAASDSVTVTSDGAITITDDTALTITANASGDNDDAVTVTAELATAVSLVDVNNDSTITAPALTNLTLTDAAADNDVTVTLDNLTATALTVSLSGGDNDVTLVDNDDVVESLTVTMTGDATLTLEAQAATALVINGAGAVTLDDNDSGGDNGLDAVETITVSGDASLTVDTATMAAFTSLTSTSTGNIDVTIDNDVTITTGAGDDTVTLTVALAADDTISTGAGNDRVEIVSNSIAAVAAGAINAGEGDLDVIAADNDELGTNYSSDIQGFEVLAVVDRLVNAQTVDVDNFDGVQRVVLEGGYDNDVTITNIDSGADITIAVGASGTTPTLVLDVTGAAIGDNDAHSVTVNLEHAGAADNDYGNIDITGIETVTLNAVATGNDGVDNDITVGFDNDDDLTTLTINVSAEDNDSVDELTIDTALDSVDTVNASGAGTADITIDFTGNSGVVYTGSAGVDTVTMGELGSITGGGDNDVFVVTEVSASNKYSTIADLQAGDVIDFDDNDGGTETDAIFNADMIELADTAAFADFVLAATSVAATDNDAELSWFQYQGNTYAVLDGSAADGYVAAEDQIVKITGLVDLSDSTITTDGTNALTFI